MYVIHKNYTAQWFDFRDHDNSSGIVTLERIACSDGNPHLDRPVFYTEVSKLEESTGHDYVVNSWELRNYKNYSTAAVSSKLKSSP